MGGYNSFLERDWADSQCLRCESGVYRIFGVCDYDESELCCDQCGDKISRWLTKSEWLRHAFEVRQ